MCTHLIVCVYYRKRTGRLKSWKSTQLRIKEKCFSKCFNLFMKYHPQREKIMLVFVPQSVFHEGTANKSVQNMPLLYTLLCITTSPDTHHFRNPMVHYFLFHRKPCSSEFYIVSWSMLLLNLHMVHIPLRPLIFICIFFFFSWYSQLFTHIYTVYYPLPSHSTPLL